MDPGMAPPPGFQIAQVRSFGALPVVEHTGQYVQVDHTDQIIGYLAESALFATLTVQTYLYYLAFPDDKILTKCLVYGVYAIELVQVILGFQAAFTTFGYGFGSLVALTDIHNNWLTAPVITGLVSLIGQCFYAYRLHILSQSWGIPAVIVVTSLASSSGAFVAGAFAKRAGNVIKLNTRAISTSMGVWLGGSALTDVIIAVCMTYYLSTHDTQFRQTRAVVHKLIRLIIETGTLTALMALTTLIVFFVFPGQGYYATPTAIMPVLYGNTIVLVLNSRFQIVGGRSTHTLGPNSMLVFANSSSGRHTGTIPGTSSAHPAPFITINRGDDLRPRL
ncbi:hypothetical protein MVEN_00977400 [Mycena venus]|uniref:DUF6534 domain-containing protein n=1 Tax=Mycena venus TaxID=2733690 RepID=A0A8H7D2L2_9AGAR|nr:hypothetical protein MVEN_00977400 [Mycena venus]